MKIHQGYLSLIAGILLLVLLFFFTDDFVRGAEAGLTLCGKIVIPSLFPFLIASSLAGYGKIPSAAKKLIEPVMQFVFGLPAECITAVILGQFGGYLSGTKAIQSLRSEGIINRNQADRLLLFSVNAGMGFSVNAVGHGMLNSREAGKVLLFSLCISSVMLGVISKFATKEQPESAAEKPADSLPFSAAVVDSVRSGTYALLTACGFVIAFSGIGCVAENLIDSPSARLIFGCLLEVTKGCAAISDKVSLPVIAAVCAFGGICVHMQIFALTDNINIPRFLLFRLLHSGIAYAVCRIYLFIRPVTLTASVTFYSNARLFSFSAPASISLLFLCALLILDLDNSRKIC